MVTSARIVAGENNIFPITTSLHQWGASSPHLFALVIDDFTRHIQDNVPWCMSLADDIVLIMRLEQLTIKGSCGEKL